MSTLPPLSFPSPLGLIFLLPLLTTTLLLHPRIPDAISRPLRLLLILPTVYLAARAPFDNRIGPEEASIGANFRIGIFGPYFVLKALEFGLAIDRSPYTWIGVISAGKKVEQATAPEREGFAKTGYEEIGKTHEKLVVKQERKEMHHSVGEMIFWSINLLSSMRGIGFAFGPPEYTLDVSRPRQRPGRFLLGAGRRILVAHFISTTMLLVVVARQSLRNSILQSFIPLPVVWLHHIANIASMLAVGFNLWANMNIGAEFISIVSLTIIQSLRFLLPLSSRLRPHPFNSLEYPALFVSPYWPDRGVAMFWRKNWHSLFRRTFTEIGYWPVAKLFGTLFGKDAGKIAGVFSVFALSGWLHHQAIISATHSLPTPTPPLPFFTAYGAPLFFLAQAFAVLLESYYMRWTGRKLHGAGAVLWTYAVVVGFGCWAARSWIALGLVAGLPQPEEWSWQRFVIPSAALLPPPLWTVPSS